MFNFKYKVTEGDKVVSEKNVTVGKTGTFLLAAGVVALTAVAIGAIVGLTNRANNGG